MKRELIYSFAGVLAGVVAMIAPTLSYPFDQLGSTLPSPLKSVRPEVYVAPSLVSMLFTISLMILTSILIAGSCAFIVKKQSK